MSKVQNVVNYGVADVPDELIAELGPRWVPGDSLVKPPFVPPWEGGVSDGSTTPTPVVPVTLQRVDAAYKPGGLVDFTIVKGEVNDPDGEEAFYFACQQQTAQNGYVTGRSFSKTFVGAGPFDCSLEDLYGDGVNDSTRKKVTFKVTPTAADAAEAKATTTKKAPTAKG